MKKALVVSWMVFFVFSQGCKTEHKVEVDVKPMQITIDVNIRVDRQLEDFFGNSQNNHSIVKTGNGEKKFLLGDTINQLNYL